MKLACGDSLAARIELPKNEQFAERPSDQQDNNYEASRTTATIVPELRAARRF
jgi:hypothetical protein